jgi:hypothetical protein
MAENALYFDGTDDEVVLGSPAAFDDYGGGTAFTYYCLYRGDGTRSLFSRLFAKDDAGDNFGWDMIWYNDMKFRDRRATPSEFEFSTSGTGATTWYWVIIAHDSSDGSTSGYRATFGGSLVSDTPQASQTGSGTRSSDAANDLRVGRGLSGGWWQGGIAFFGIESGKKSIVQAQATVDAMVSASWVTATRMGKNGAATAVDEAAAASITVNGSPTLITDAPNYWTGGSAPTTRFRIRWP